MNKEIIEIKWIYKATRDGGDSKTFHKLCDGISNTLVLYKSAGNRRFGGFVSQCWQKGKDDLLDENCFLFSLDKNNIYYSKNNDLKITINSFVRPSFSINGKYIIRIYNNELKGKNLLTDENKYKDIFNEEKNVISEDGSYKGYYSKEYEVFQIFFI